jgi:type VI secretion system protein ImpM
MPQILTDAARTLILTGGAIGFHGKIPARGDFVQAGLPRAFTDPWDSWMQRTLAASRTALGEAWLPAWLEAAVWRFALMPGACGPDAAIGLWMPSVDRVGRYYPLTLAAVVPDADYPTLMHESGGFLAAAECAGRAALANELAPDELAARLAAATTAPPTASGGDPLLCPPHGGLWWTEGAPRVPAGTVASAGLPDANAFCAMLASCSSAPPALLLEQAR